jgi:hypothetical protein
MLGSSVHVSLSPTDATDLMGTTIPEKGNFPEGKS